MVGNKATGNPQAELVPAVRLRDSWAPTEGGTPDGDELAGGPVGLAAQAARDTLDAALARLADFAALWSAA